MFRWIDVPWKDNGVILEVCCRGIVCLLAEGKYRVDGITNEYPSLTDKNSKLGMRVIFCPFCGERLKPEEQE